MFLIIFIGALLHRGVRCISRLDAQKIDSFVCLSLVVLWLFEKRHAVSVSLRLFSSSSVEGIVHNLKADGSAFAKKQAEVRSHPTATGTCETI